ncbi:hypothetical protein CJ030_MR4G029034 [Morella rubra]|uniref:Uncharacterized protein n=1 Tax=Morella rubra TaxID=262757 RepID=A0A6A1VTY2_9ROSI|nr:hypothetical protein CJ030_MR0G010415 [Morella rubra]KAB1216432.1 hypothetical protein CJ030_MR4G029034 [Morella rubra]
MAAARYGKYKGGIMCIAPEMGCQNASNPIHGVGKGEILQVRTASISVSQPLWKAALMACIVADEGTWQSVELKGDSLNAYTAITHNGNWQGYGGISSCRLSGLP